MELLLNVYAASKARGAVADFMGHCLVAPEEATRSLTPGLWLVRGQSPAAWMWVLTGALLNQQCCDPAMPHAGCK